MKILVTGAAGMLGRSMIRVFRAAGHEVTATDLRPSDPDCQAVDACSRTDVDAALRQAQADLAVHLVAETSVEHCEADPVHALATNAGSTRTVARACRAARIPMAYISTACVFDGSKSETVPYTESDTPQPLNVYGNTKYRGELWLRDVLDECFIVRTCWLMGGGERDHKFVGMILGQLAAGASRIRAVADMFGSPTYTDDLSTCLLELVQTRNFGLFHMAGVGGASRYDIARHIVAETNADGVVVEPVASAFFDGPNPVPRPRSEVMANGKLTALGLDRMRPWQVALSDYLARQRLPLR